MFSERAVREFKESTIWQEIADTLKERKGMYEDDFRKANPFKEPEKIAQVQGALVEIDYFLLLPDILAEEGRTTTKIKKEEASND